MSHKETWNEKVHAFIKKQQTAIKTDQKKQFIFFVLGFLLFYLVLTAVAYSLPQGFFEGITGQSVNTLLTVQGFKTHTISDTSFHIVIDDKEIIISWLCAGALEIIILISAILASFGISWKEKAVGVIGAIIAGYIFNLVRIMVTINLILTQSAPVFELAHDVLFRVTLFVYIVVFYVAWFYWATAKKARK